MTVAAILKHKGTDVARAAPTATIAEVAQLLASRRIGAILVMDTANQVMGIVSERDIVGSLAEHGSRTLEMTAAQLMTRSISVAHAATTVAEATAMMTAGRFRHLPVMDGDRLLGIVSIGDIVKARLSQQEQEVDSLKAYVAGAA
ncbi:MAG: CBS domain-containing protein [Gemmatimonadaceae bacterium]|nr:CBS domain-containing protein [Acetobacteraceae bacterium]